MLTRSERCSQASETRGEPMAGTASTVRSWILLEDPGPWGGDALRDARFERFLSTRLPLIRGALVDQGALDGIADGSRLARRGGSICVIRIRGDRLVVLLGDRRLEMPAWLEPAMRRVAATPSFVVEDLADVLPDPGARTVLARRLVREGLLRPLP
ncbi:MAG TPA: hypothetical protein VE444_11130 [Gaiellaceae bacterium]|nr:hypothetical protein [Gaiellaceae bacterium]